MIISSSSTPRTLPSVTVRTEPPNRTTDWITHSSRLTTGSNSHDSLNKSSCRVRINTMQMIFWSALGQHQGPHSVSLQDLTQVLLLQHHIGSVRQGGVLQLRLHQHTQTHEHSWRDEVLRHIGGGWRRMRRRRMVLMMMMMRRRRGRRFLFRCGIWVLKPSCYRTDSWSWEGLLVSGFISCQRVN